MHPRDACKKKKRFPSKKAAVAEATSRGWCNKSAYACEYCGGYHLTKKSGRSVLKLLEKIERSEL